MEHWLIGALIAFALGAFVSFANYLLSRTVLRKKPQFYPFTAILRQVFNVAWILAVFFIAPVTPWSRTVLLIGGVFGITIPMIFFTFLLLRETGKTPVENSHTKGDSR